MPIPPEEFSRLAPLLLGWIASTLQSHAADARPVASAGFERLPLYFSGALLERAKFVPVARVPTPPLAAMGLKQFSGFEQMDAAGITYLDTYFVHSGSVASERLHFHELIHVVQWQTLGPERFLMRYANGLEQSGYRDSPLEVTAYDAEARFVSNPAPFDAEELVRASLG